MARPVIAGVDGSASSLEAVVVAAHEAHLRGAPLRIVHAFGHRPVGGPPGSPPDHGLEPMVRGTLARAEERARTAAPGVAITRSVVAGEAVQLLEIELRSASLAEVGSRGLSGFSGLLLGSVSQALLHHAHCPVTVVRDKG
ncbi:universal stress protein [Streptomyces sp. NPDC101219]|uniref:universal stress protein n=1 Tax=Streptomyces sp. NPDC101219 TaxID=3366131 RepID=UPI00381473F0